MHSVGNLPVMPGGSRHDSGVKSRPARRGGTRAQSPTRRARLGPAAMWRSVTELAEMARP
jgi:hypothetical protein